jgi:pilus assembly protein CpaF
VSEDILDYLLVKSLQAQIADEVLAHKQRRERSGLPALSLDDERQMARSLMHATVSRHMETRLAHGGVLPDGDYDARLVKAIDDAMYEAGALQELLDEDLIENIDINGCDEVWITYADLRGKVRGAPVTATDEDLIVLLQTLASYAGVNARPFTPAHPVLDIRLPDGSRLSAVMSATERPAASIRRNRFPQMTMPELVRLGTATPDVGAFLKAAVLARKNILIAGATDAGKTTTARACINCIPPTERLLVIERSLELSLRRFPELHPDVLEMEEVLPDQDGHGGLSLRRLVYQSRRMNPSRVILGEVLGPESVELLGAFSQGNEGGLSTIHARSALDAFDRLATYAAMYDQMDFGVSHSLMANAIDFVVFVQKNRRLGGRRCITQIIEVGGYDKDRVSSARIFGPSAVDGRAERDLDVPIQRLDDLTDVGWQDHPGWAAGSGWLDTDPINADPINGELRNAVTGLRGVS